MKNTIVKLTLISLFFFTSFGFGFTQPNKTLKKDSSSISTPVVSPVTSIDKTTISTDKVIADAKKTVEEYNKTVEEKNKLAKEVIELSRQEIENGKKINKLIKNLIKKYKKNPIISNNTTISEINPIKIDSICIKERKVFLGKEVKCVEQEITFYTFKNNEKVILQKLITKR